MNVSLRCWSVNCCYCQQSHLSRDCKVVTQPVARKQLLLKSAHCFVCLYGLVTLCVTVAQRADADSANKNFTHWLYTAGDSSHMGEQPRPISSLTSTQLSWRTVSNEPQLNLHAPLFFSQTLLLCISLLTRQCFSKQHSPLYITLICRHAVTRRIRAVLDLKRQCSYINKWAVTALQLNSEGTRWMSIFTFGSMQSTLSECELVRVLIETRDGKMELHLLSFVDHWPLNQWLSAPPRMSICLAWSWLTQTIMTPSMMWTCCWEQITTGS